MGKCKKDKNTSDNTNVTPEDCIQSGAVGSGEIVAGRYIVAYKPSSVSARGMTAERLNSIGTNVLKRNNISERALKESFAGEPGGFIAVLSAEEANKLGNDENIEAVEPDRIISLGSCFTIAAPRLITWNVDRVGYGNGIGKRAWIVDTGIDFDHPDLTVDATKSKSFITGVSSAHAMKPVMRRMQCLIHQMCYSLRQ